MRISEHTTPQRNPNRKHITRTQQKPQFDASNNRDALPSPAQNSIHMKRNPRISLSLVSRDLSLKTRRQARYVIFVRITHSRDLSNASRIAARQHGKRTL